MRVYDPVGSSAAAEIERPGVVYCSSELEAVEGADGLIIATEWNQFRGIDPEALKRCLKGDVICDLRNVYEPAAMRAKGFRYFGVGR